jgi:CubicO group peptidase (beta-lactamase class C family)
MASIIMTLRKISRIFLWLLGALLIIAIAGYIWLRNSPYWVGVTLFADDYRVANFRSMDTVFPFEPVSRSGPVWALETAPRALPESFGFNGQDLALSAFLERTETTGFLVLHQGQIAHESYYLGGDETSQFTSWSVAKSVLSALIGIAIDEGHIADITDPIERYVPALAGTAYGAVPIEDALTMSSGIGFDEDYDNPMSDVNMLFVSFPMGTPLAETIHGQDALRPPGEYNNYISSDSIALGLALEGATGMSAHAYLQSRLWGPMGAEADAFWSTNRAGDILPLCCLNATLRDYGRFGQLYLQNGARDGQQIVPADWVAASVTPSAPHLEPGDNPASSWTFGYGYHWWIPEEPQGDYTAIGIWGQYIYVDPVREVVIVKTSADYHFDDNDHETIAAFRAIARDLAGE